MKSRHIIKDENHDIYKRLKELYKNKDFKTPRTNTEKEIELEIINELPNHIISILNGASKDTYLEELSKMDSKTPGFSHFLNAMNSSLDAMVSSTDTKKEAE